MVPDSRRPPRMVTGIGHVGVWVSDLEESLKFYLNIPRIEEAFRLYKEDGSLMLVYLKIAPRQFVELFQGGSASKKSDSGYYHVCLQTDDIHALYQELVDRGISPRSQPKRYDDDHSWQFWVDDPDGNAIEFQQLTPESLQAK
jgi:lactoylglutathione lyase